MSIVQILFYQPTFNLLIVLYRAFSDNLGLAIIVVAVLSRIITMPITKKQIKSAEDNKVFKKEYDEIKAKYKNKPEEQKEKLAKLQMQYLPSQLGGCLPLILQLILLIQIRNVIVNLVNNGADAFNSVAYPFVAPFPPGAVINFHFLGLDLSKVATNIGLSNIPAVLPYIALALLVGLTQFFSSKVLMGLRTDPMEEEKKKEDKKKKDQDKKSSGPDFSESMQQANKQMIYFFPILTSIMSMGFLSGGAAVSVFPSGISLFWTIQNLFIVGQELFMNRKKIGPGIRNFDPKKMFQLPKLKTNNFKQLKNGGQKKGSDGRKNSK
ncbi:membrane protein insertase YidC [Candidatus Dojkabacteria bacterium]|uniref:Membrane protein insertase YidC n=1 Tax=Candidatus Dojkabacteria bacterium TaxID=2099670 RepID=A0A955L3A4_9BACT|nr:membrane protein insertase YidC [Candidatus Dojkabacteria bacterium]